MGGNLVRLGIKDAGGSGRVNVETIIEGFDHGLVLAKGRHDTQFDLRVVSGEQGELIAARNEGAADLAALIRANRDVL